jgi:hypothetical protein
MHESPNESLDIRHMQRGYSALMCATDAALVGCVQLLLDAGADKDAKANVRFNQVFYSIFVSLVIWHLRSSFCVRVLCGLNFSLTMHARVIVWMVCAAAVRALTISHRMDGRL